MSGHFRVIDTGLRGGRANIAFDQAMIELRAEGAIGDTIRFLRFTPTALVGRHQILRHEIDLTAAQARTIELGRRVTGGGAIYLDSAQLGWEILCRREVFGPMASLDRVAERICSAAAAGLARLGVPAAFRPRNDIEVEGRKIGGTGGFFDGDFLFYQGTVLFGLDIETMLAVLRVPAAKLARHGATSLRERLAGLEEILGRAVAVEEVKAALLAGWEAELGWRFTPADPSPLEEEAAARLFAEEIGTDRFVFEPDLASSEARWRSAVHQHPGGRIRADVALDHRGIIRDVVLSGDFFLTPPRRIPDLEAFLRGSPAAEVPERVETFFATYPTTLLGLAARDFGAVIAAALSAPAGTGESRPAVIDPAR